LDLIADQLGLTSEWAPQIQSAALKRYGLTETLKRERTLFSINASVTTMTARFSAS
jgi:hypothetical protein